MSLARFYLYREKVIVPSVEQTEDGFYMDSKPIIVIDIRCHSDIFQALTAALNASNKVVPTPEPSDETGSVLLDKLNLVKWSSFEKFAVMYTVFRGGRYTTIYETGRGADGMWNNEASEARYFHPTVSVSVIARLIIEDMVKRPEARSERFGLIPISKHEPESRAST